MDKPKVDEEATQKAVEDGCDVLLLKDEEEDDAEYISEKNSA